MTLPVGAAPLVGRPPTHRSQRPHAATPFRCSQSDHSLRALGPSATQPRDSTTREVRLSASRAPTVRSTWLRAGSQRTRFGPRARTARVCNRVEERPPAELRAERFAMTAIARRPSWALVKQPPRLGRRSGRTLLLPGQMGSGRRRVSPWPLCRQTSRWLEAAFEAKAITGSDERQGPNRAARGRQARWRITPDWPHEALAGAGLRVCGGRRGRLGRAASPRPIVQAVGHATLEELDVCISRSDATGR